MRYCSTRTFKTKKYLPNSPFVSIASEASGLEQECCLFLNKAPTQEAALVWLFRKQSRQQKLCQAASSASRGEEVFTTLGAFCWSDMAIFPGTRVFSRVSGIKWKSKYPLSVCLKVCSDLNRICVTYQTIEQCSLTLGLFCARFKTQGGESKGDYTVGNREAKAHVQSTLHMTKISSNPRHRSFSKPRRL